MAYSNYGNNGGGYRPQNRQNAAPRNSNARASSSTTPEISSPGPVLYNSSAGKFLNFNYWGRYASLEIGAVPAGSSFDWNTRKNAQMFKQVIGFNDLSDLQDLCEEVLESLKNTGTFTSAGIRVGQRQDAIVEINNGSNLNLAPGVYLVIYKNLDQNGRTNNLEFYAFEHGKVIRGYDHTSGSGKEDISKVGGFKKFYKMVKEAVKAFTMAQAHVQQTVTKGDRIAAFKTLSAIAQKTGCDMIAELNNTLNALTGGGGNNRSGGYSGGNRYGNNGGGYSRSAPRSSSFENQGGGFANNAAMSSMNEPIDINLNIDELTNVDMSQFN